MAPGLSCCGPFLRVSGARAHPHHETVVGELGDLHPGERLRAVRDQAGIELAEMRIGRKRSFAALLIGA